MDATEIAVLVGGVLLVGFVVRLFFTHSAPTRSSQRSSESQRRAPRFRVAGLLRINSSYAFDTDA